MNTLIAEALGTFILVFSGVGAIIVNTLTDGVVGNIGIAITFGLVVCAIIYSIGNISGAHINPAVTIGFCIARNFPIYKGCAYIAAQCVGAIMASAVLFFLFPEVTQQGVTVPAGSFLQSFIIEILLTFILFFVILNVSTGAMEKGIMAGVAIGGTVMLQALWAGPISGASMNPARSLGPALIAGEYTFLWIYILGPLLGVLLACPLCRIIQGEECCYSKK